MIGDATPLERQMPARDPGQFMKYPGQLISGKKRGLNFFNPLFEYLGRRELNLVDNPLGNKGLAGSCFCRCY